MFEISQIRCFVAVAEELHFGRAAERLNMTQPPLSRQISLLEHHVGTQLLERSSRIVRLTAAGKSFFPEAARLLRLAEEAALTARRVAKGEQGSLAIGFTAASGYGLLPQLIRALHERSPGISLTLREMVSRAQLEALATRQLDIGLIRPLGERNEFDSQALFRERLVLAVPAAEAGRWPQEPGLECLHGKPFFMYSPYEARYFYQLIVGLFECEDVAPDFVEYVSQIHTMLALVSSGMGVALIPEAATRLRFEGVVLRPVVTTPERPVETVCAFRGDNDNPVLEVFRRDVLSRFRQAD